MKALTAEQYRAALDTQRALVQKGVHPARAGAIVRRAIDRASSCCDGCAQGKICCNDGGLGRIQMRSVRRDLFPGLPPRPTVAGEQCVRIAETPGNEMEMYKRLSDYRNRGWNVIEVSRTQGFPSTQVYWACPPGRVPMEGQRQVFESGVGATTVPTGPVAIKTGETVSDQAPPSILANVAAAGDDPTIAAARNVVSKWSFVIPVFGLVMSLKDKIVGKGADVASVTAGGRRR